jgi:hypothetical protein
VGTTDSYTFPASVGNSIVTRAGGTNFTPLVRIYGPDGALLAASISMSLNNRDGEASVRATNSGTFTVTVSSYYANGAGGYGVSLGQSPGEITIAAGDDGGPTTNGWRHTGVLEAGDLDTWNFAAAIGDSIVLRAGGTNFTPYIRLYGPDGSLQIAISSSSVNNRDAETSFRATNSGTFSIVLSPYYLNTSGGYRLSLAKSPGSIAIAPGDQGGPLTNGWRHEGIVEVGDLDEWNFLANAGDRIVVRMGGTNFTPFLRLYGPDGAVQATSSSSSVNNIDGEATFRATNSGNFTLIASAYYLNDSGGYTLSLAKAPGLITIPPADEGGPMTNGWRHTGVLEVGDLDTWSFAAAIGESIVLRAGGTNFTPNIRLYGPDGSLQAASSSSSVNNVDAQALFRATNSGSYTVVASAHYLNGYGGYSLTMAKSPGSIVTAPGDEGGPLAPTSNYVGWIDIGDEDVWTFTACRGENLMLRVTGTNFTPAMRLYGPDGTLAIANASSSVNTREATVSFQATNCGPFVMVLSSYYLNGSGAYQLISNGLSDTLRLCVPIIQGGTLQLNGIGGQAQAPFILYKSEDVVLPFSSWTPVLTNVFDDVGVFGYTNAYSPATQQEYFRLLLP